MKVWVKNFGDMINFNSLVAVLIAIVSTSLSIYYDLVIDFPLTIVGIAVVFPIVFSINGAYKRREICLNQYAVMKSSGRCMYLASRDWLRDTGAKAQTNVRNFQESIYNIFDKSVSLFKEHKSYELPEEEVKVYKAFSEMSLTIEKLRDRGLNGSEVSRINSYLSRMLTAFETLKHIYQYRTPTTLRLYSRFYIYVILLALGPYFSLLSKSSTTWLIYSLPILFALVLTGLDNIQSELENPFDQYGKDDIKINSKKFKDTLLL